MGKTRKYRSRGKTMFCDAVKEDQCESQDSTNVDVKMEDTNSKSLSQHLMKEHMLDIIKETLSDRSQKKAKSQNSKVFPSVKMSMRKWQLRHNFMQKVRASEEKCELLRKIYRRKKQPIVGDMKPLEDALPTLQPLQRENTVKEKVMESTKPLACRSEYAKHKAMMEGIATFHQVLNHPSFIQDPATTIKIHLQNKFQSVDTNI